MIGIWLLSYWPKKPRSDLWPAAATAARCHRVTLTLTLFVFCLFLHKANRSWGGHHRGNGDWNPFGRWRCERAPPSFLRRCCHLHRGKDCHVSSGWCTQCFCEPDGPAVHAEPWLSERLEIYLWDDSPPICGNRVQDVHSQAPLSKELTAQLEGWLRRMFLHLVLRKYSRFFAIRPLHNAVRGKEM